MHDECHHYRQGLVPLVTKDSYLDDKMFVLIMVYKAIVIVVDRWIRYGFDSFIE